MGIYKLPPASGPLSSSLKWSLISFSLPVLSIPESLKESKVRTKFWKRKETEGEERRGRNVTESRLRGSQGPVDAPRPLASRPRTVPGPVPLRIPLGVPSCQGHCVCSLPGERALWVGEAGGLTGRRDSCAHEPARSPPARRAVLVSPVLSVQMPLHICQPPHASWPSPALQPRLHNPPRPAPALSPLRLTW